MHRRLIEANEAISRPQVLPDVFIGREVGQPDCGAGWECPCPERLADVFSTQRGVEAVRLLDNVRHMRELLPENDGSQVRVISLTNSVDQNGFCLEGACGSAEEEDVRSRLEGSILCRALGRPSTWIGLSVAFRLGWRLANNPVACACRYTEDRLRSPYCFVIEEGLRQLTKSRSISSRSG